MTLVHHNDRIACSPDSVLELQPMNPYQRLLLHRLADIYGFSHESIGEGEERHLLLERCPETAVPPILVSDILWEYDDCQPSTASHQLQMRKESPARILKTETREDKPAQSSTPLEVREAAYLAARERIFSQHEATEMEVAPPKSRKVPMVAQRMIAHALGQKVSSLNLCEENAKNSDSVASTLKDAKKTSGTFVMRNPALHQMRGGHSLANTSSYDSSSESQGNMRNGLTTHGRAVNPENLEKEQIGAAKRIFAQALGFSSTSRSRDAAVKTNEDKA